MKPKTIKKEMKNLNIVLEKIARITLGSVMFISTLLASLIVMPFYLATLVITKFQKPKKEMIYVKVPANRSW
ncbi:hypothetical protein [Flexithrix dorotheae]|uniref:hypothetical protein n=1 Tax=Flexithrix dorotheae TaxID=70993 RepID=UPI00037C7DAB|nr:hypothetical protein [Flexithrix dorotheae]